MWWLSTRRCRRVGVAVGDAVLVGQIVDDGGVGAARAGLGQVGLVHRHQAAQAVVPGPRRRRGRWRSPACRRGPRWRSGTPASSSARAWHRHLGDLAADLVGARRARRACRSAGRRRTPCWLPDSIRIASRLVTKKLNRGSGPLESAAKSPIARSAAPASTAASGDTIIDASIGAGPPPVPRSTRRRTAAGSRRGAAGPGRLAARPALATGIPGFGGRGTAERGEREQHERRGRWAHPWSFPPHRVT